MGYDNLARKTEPVYTRARKRKRRTVKRKKEEYEMLQRKRLVTRIFCIVIVTLAASFMISRFVEVKDRKSELTRLNARYSQMQANTLQKQRDYNDDDSELKTSLEEEAEKLHMQRPEKHQIIYVEVDREDETEVTAREVEGFGKRIKTVAEEIFSNIVNYFSIG